MVTVAPDEFARMVYTLAGRVNTNLEQRNRELDQRFGAIEQIQLKEASKLKPPKTRRMLVTGIDWQREVEDQLKKELLGSQEYGDKIIAATESLRGPGITINRISRGWKDHDLIFEGTQKKGRISVAMEPVRFLASTAQGVQNEYGANVLLKEVNLSHCPSECVRYLPEEERRKVRGYG